jgi:sugar lactone lactonase YvrE
MITMFDFHPSSAFTRSRLVKLILVLGLLATLPVSLFGGKKKKQVDAPKKPVVIDYSNIVWPNPPAVARIKYQAFFAAQQLSQVDSGTKTKKESWMDRLAGTPTQADNPKALFQLVQPYGIAVDSKGQLYVADAKVGAIFVFNTETRAADLIKNRVNAHFVRIVGLTIDDDDRLFVSDPGLRHVLVFNPEHKPTDVITDGMAEPGNLAIDTENRLLYVSDISLDQVLVYDADSFKLIRKMGTTGKNHTLTSPGDFAKPTGLAVDKDGNLYVCDTLNDRIEVFDADGNFIQAYGKNGDGPGYFARPKGITVDSDGHIWVADGMQDRVQVFTKDWQLCISFGGHGLLPGQFQGLVSVYADKHNRIFTSEIFPGRVQQFRYVTDEEAAKLEKEKEALRQKKAGAKPEEPAPAATPSAEDKSAGK